MGKIPVNKLLNSTKNVGTFIKENKEVIQTIGNSIPLLKDISEKTIQSLKSSNPSGKNTLSKATLYRIPNKYYASSPFLHVYWINYEKSEVRSFIEQISHEQQSIKIKNPKFSIWKKNWETIFIQLEDIITNQSYHAFLEIYHSNEIKNTFFEAKIVNHFKAITENAKLIAYIQKYSKSSKEEIIQDFDLCWLETAGVDPLAKYRFTTTQPI